MKNGTWRASPLAVVSALVIAAAAILGFFLAKHSVESQNQALLREDAVLTMPPPAVAAEFFVLLGGGQQDAGWDGSARPASRLAILPGATHYDMLEASSLPQIVVEFLG